MDTARKKELQEEWKNRKPEMGVIAFRCKETGESFFAISKDTKKDYNRSRFQLSFGSHPNKRLQELWNRYGEEGVEFAVVKVLKYKDPLDDHTKELEKLWEQCLMDEPGAGRIR